MTNCEIDDACRMLHPSPASPNHFITYLPKNCRPNPNVLLALSHKYVHNRSSIKIIPSTNKYLLYILLFIWKRISYIHNNPQCINGGGIWLTWIIMNWFCYYNLINIYLLSRFMSLNIQQYGIYHIDSKVHCAGVSGRFGPHIVYILWPMTNHKININKNIIVLLIVSIHLLFFLFN